MGRGLLADEESPNLNRPRKTPHHRTFTAYLARLSDDRLAEYDTAWSDEHVMEWDGNFRSDGGPMLTCCERDVDVGEYRRVLERHLAWRKSQAVRGGPG
jgi:hypothetical protein